ncbi:MAG TPA: site-specific integrase [Gemmataceae bacterium]|nr:site-specific integrase [Gemmataceae bacterium]
MFERLFRHPYALEPHLNGPLAEERRRFLCHRAEQGYSHTGLRVLAYYLLACARSLRLADRPGDIISFAEVEEKAALWANRSPQPSGLKRLRCSQGQFLCFAHAWLRFLGRLEMPTTPPSPFVDQIATFATFLLRDKGLGSKTVESRCQRVRRFLDQLAVPNSSLHHITLSQIDQALVEQLTQDRYARVTVQGMACDLRSFFSYAETRGWCRLGLAAGIKGPRVFPQESLPAGPSWDDVRRLLASAGGDSPADIRDRVILMLLAVYGFRACEVRCLQLEDFDWHNERLCVTRGKTRSTHIYPLRRAVGDAVLRYLKEARPRSSHRQVFLTLRAPFRPLGNAAVGCVVGRRLHSLGLTLPHFGSHTLRHACATHLLEEGLCLKEIGDHLGHRHPDTTRIYAKVNLTALRQVADFDLGGLL